MMKINSTSLPKTLSPIKSAVCYSVFLNNANAIKIVAGYLLKLPHEKKDVLSVVDKLEGEGKEPLREVISVLPDKKPTKAVMKIVYSSFL